MNMEALESSLERHFYLVGKIILSRQDPVQDCYLQVQQ